LSDTQPVPTQTKWCLLNRADFRLEMSCCTGDHVTGTVSDEYLAWVESNQAY